MSARSASSRVGLHQDSGCIPSRRGGGSARRGSLHQRAVRGERKRRLYWTVNLTHARSTHHGRICGGYSGPRARAPREKRRYLALIAKNKNKEGLPGSVQSFQERNALRLIRHGAAAAGETGKSSRQDSGKTSGQEYQITGRQDQLNTRGIDLGGPVLSRTHNSYDDLVVWLQGSLDFKNRR